MIKFRRPGPRLSIIVGAVFLLVLVLGVQAYISLSDRARTLNDAARSTQYLVAAWVQHSDHAFAYSSAVLANIAADVAASGGMQRAGSQRLHDILRRRHDDLNSLPGTPPLAELFILDANGRPFASSIAHPAAGDAAAWATIARHHRETGVAEPRIGDVSASPAGGATIPLTRALRDANGRLAGIAGVHLRTEHFSPLQATLDLPEGSVFTLIRRDGSLLFRHPAGGNSLATDLSGDRQFQTMAAAGKGVFATSDGLIGGGGRLAAYRTSERHPYLAVASLPMKNLMARWQRNTLQTAAIGVLLVALLLALATLAYRQIGHLERTVFLATHDELTRLWNRAAFDERLEDEWRRAMRHGKPLSLLFVDIDHFKRYNDNYGHAKGDRCLAAVACILGECFNRGGDFICRFGGEKFAVLLPEVDTDAAMNAGRRLIEAMQQNALPHGASPVAPYVTVSIGQATMAPSSAIGTEELIYTADAALYAAKEQGRNRIAAAPNDATTTD